MTKITLREFVELMGFEVMPWQEAIIERFDKGELSLAVSSQCRRSEPFIGVELARGPDKTSVFNRIDWSNGRDIRPERIRGVVTNQVVFDDIDRAKARAWFDLKTSMSRLSDDDDADKYAFEPHSPDLDTSPLAYTICNTELDRIQANIEKVRAADKVRAELGPIGPMQKRAHKLVHENLRKTAKRREAETSQSKKV